MVFSDHTEVLLSREARVVTFVDKDGRRETLSLQRVLQDQRCVSTETSLGVGCSRGACAAADVVMSMVMMICQSFYIFVANCSDSQTQR